MSHLRIKRGWEQVGFACPSPQRPAAHSSATATIAPKRYAIDVSTARLHRFAYAAPLNRGVPGSKLAGFLKSDCRIRADTMAMAVKPTSSLLARLLLQKLMGLAEVLFIAEVSGAKEPAKSVSSEWIGSRCQSTEGRRLLVLILMFRRVLYLVFSKDPRSACRNGLWYETSRGERWPL